MSSEGKGATFTKGVWESFMEDKPLETGFEAEAEFR